jgi:tripartite-type tricarboxylate transporter receptor subunit TctC
MGETPMVRMSLIRHLVFVVAGGVIAFGGLTLPSSAAEPLKGKTVTILVGTSPGGGYDFYARMLARYLPKHLPGTSVVVKNMTGGGGLRLATYLYGAAPSDGTEFGLTEYGVPFSSLLYGTPVQFDVLKFNWLGAIDAYVTPMVLAWHATPFRTFEDVLAMPMSVGATGATSFTAGYPYALNGILGAKFNVTLGYPGATDVTLAMERRELDGIVSWCWKCMKHQRPEWIREHKARVLLQLGTKGDPELDAQGVRTVMDVARTDEQKALLRAVFGGLGMAKSFFAPPDVPAETVAVLRKAIEASARDPEMNAFAEKAGYDVTYVPPEEIMAILRDAYGLDPVLVQTLRAAIAGKR